MNAPPGTAAPSDAPQSGAPRSGAALAAAPGPDDAPAPKLTIAAALAIEARALERGLTGTISRPGGPVSGAKHLGRVGAPPQAAADGARLDSHRRADDRVGHALPPDTYRPRALSGKASRYR